MSKNNVGYHQMEWKIIKMERKQGNKLVKAKTSLFPFHLMITYKG